MAQNDVILFKARTRKTNLLRACTLPAFPRRAQNSAQQHTEVHGGLLGPSVQKPLYNWATFHLYAQKKRPKGR